MFFIGDNIQQQQPEALNKKALAIITRVREKLTGHDFEKTQGVPMEKQVELLIKQATSNENLCQCYIGWFVQKSILPRTCWKCWINETTFRIFRCPFW